MVKSQSGDPRHMTKIDLQLAEPVGCELFRNKALDRIGEFEFAQAEFDGHLPDADETEQALVFRIGNRCPCFAR